MHTWTLLLIHVFSCTYPLLRIYKQMIQTLSSVHFHRVHLFGDLNFFCRQTNSPFTDQGSYGTLLLWNCSKQWIDNYRKRIRRITISVYSSFYSCDQPLGELPACSYALSMPEMTLPCCLVVVVGLLLGNFFLKMGGGGGGGFSLLAVVILFVRHKVEDRWSGDNPGVKNNKTTDQHFFLFWGGSVWPGVRLVSGWTLVPLAVSALVCFWRKLCGLWHCLVTLPFTMNKLLKWLTISSLPILKPKSCWWWQCSVSIVPPPPQAHPLLLWCRSLTVTSCFTLSQPVQL